MKLRKITILMLLTALTLSGCSKFNLNNTSGLTPEVKETNTKVEPKKYYAPYTGVEVAKEVLDKIPYMAIIENSQAARPQSGLYAADMVFETLAEGGIPRFIALYQSEDSQKIGPIRSARPYFIDITREYNLPFAHCGGSEEALQAINRDKLMGMNEFYNGSFFWRDKERIAPHNLYTSSEKLRALVKSKNYIKTPENKLSFDKSYWDNASLSAANDIVFKVNSSYSTSYKYENGSYVKYMDNKPALNKEDSLSLKVTNLVVQYTSIVQREDGRLNITLIGEGKGVVISCGKLVNIRWKRADLNSPTELFDEKGNKVPLAPGKTWWHIYSTSTKMEAK